MFGKRIGGVSSQGACRSRGCSLGDTSAMGSTGDLCLGEVRLSMHLRFLYLSQAEHLDGILPCCLTNISG